MLADHCMAVPRADEGTLCAMLRRREAAVRGRPTAQAGRALPGQRGPALERRRWRQGHPMYRLDAYRIMLAMWRIEKNSPSPLS